MLAYKAWLETRWRFLIGLVLLMISAAGVVLQYPQVIKLLALVPQVDVGGEIGRQIRESTELARDYRGYVWSQWFLKNMPQLWVLFAALLGTGGLLSNASGGGTLFTLSLPVTRDRLFGIRAAIGLAQLLVLALVPSLMVPALSPAIGHGYPIGDALVHGACLFIAGSVFFNLALLLSTVFADVWRPWLIVCGVAMVVGLAGQFSRELWPFSVFRVMSAEAYFRGDGLPWLGLLASAAVSAAVLYAAARNIARRDF